MGGVWEGAVNGSRGRGSCWGGQVVTGEADGTVTPTPRRGSRLRCCLEGWSLVKEDRGSCPGGC